MPEHQARALLLDVEQVELAADAPVIALLGLLEALQVLIQLLAVGPRGAVDPLQHLVARIAAPVGAGHLGQLEGGELAGRGHVRAAAQVDPVALAVEGDRLPGRNAGDDLGLVVLADALEVLDRRIAVHDPARHLLIRLRQLRHARFDGRQVLGGERALVGEVVEEAVLDDRADGDLGFGEQLLDGLRQQVRGGVADDFQAGRILGGDDRQLHVVIDDEGGVHQLARPRGRPGQPCATPRRYSPPPRPPSPDDRTGADCHPAMSRQA